MTSSEWTCLEKVGDEFKIVLSPTENFDNAIEVCGSEDATLARISSDLEFAFALKLITEISNNEQDSIWIGVKNSGDERDTAEYFFVDGNEDISSKGNLRCLKTSNQLFHFVRFVK